MHAHHLFLGVDMNEVARRRPRVYVALWQREVNHLMFSQSHDYTHAGPQNAGRDEQDTAGYNDHMDIDFGAPTTFLEYIDSDCDMGMDDLRDSVLELELELSS